MAEDQTKGSQAIGAIHTTPDVESVARYPYRQILDLARQKVLDGDLEEGRALVRSLFLADLYFVVLAGLERTDALHPWVVRSCQLVQDGPRTDTLDLWARGHYKSTIITHAETIREILLAAGKISVAIFSHTKTAAESHLLPIKVAFETSALLRWAFPELVWQKLAHAPIWSLANGIALPGRSSSNTATVEAYGLLEGMPTGKHYTLRIYDDLVTDDTVRTPDQIRKLERAFRLSDNLAAWDGRCRVIGTIYSYNDLYAQLLREADERIYPWHVRIRPWYDLDVYEKTGEKVPVLWTPEQVSQKRTIQGPYVWACQNECSPIADDTRRFRREWIRRYKVLPNRRNKYILVDPAHSQKKDSDYTAMAVVSLDEYGNYYLEDLIRERLGLSERWQALSDLIKRHSPALVWYERYGLQADIAYFTERMRSTGLYFPLNEVAGRVAKRDRIERLVPLFESGRFLLPDQIYSGGRDVLAEWIEDELLLYPYARHDDCLDAISRITDPEVGATGPVVTWQTRRVEAIKRSRAIIEEAVGI